MSIRNALLYAVLSLSSVLAACSSDGDSSPSSAVVDTEEVKVHHVRMAYAAYSESLASAETLHAAVNALTALPSEANLRAAQSAYKEARIPYQQSEIMRWDTAITLGKGLADDGGPASVDEWEGQVNAWPLDENHIIAIVEGDELINGDLLVAQNGADENEANVSTGIHAVEFMLWGVDNNGVGPGAGERSASDFSTAAECVDAYCARRASFLKAATDLLLADIKIMVNEWSPIAANTPGTLAHNFLNSEQALDYMLGSIRAMATDELVSARMSSGLELGDPEEEHDCFSDLSHVAIYHNYQGVRNAFYGRYADLGGPGLADLVKAKDGATYNVLDAAFGSIETKMRELLDAGEREVEPVKFDQIIGQDENGVERQIAEAAVDELVALDVHLHAVKELLSLQALSTGSGGDGD